MSGMHKRLWIFLTLYLAGLAMSPILAGESLPGEKTFFCSFEEGNLGEGQYKWQEKLPDFSYGSPVHFKSHHQFFPQTEPANLGSTQNTAGQACPLFLLFHALIFYELA
jgi:hypothetical protein